MADSPTRASRLAILLIGVLCATAGTIDVIAFLLFGKIFIANMTGNTVLFAASALQHKWPEAALRIGVVLSFLSGILLARAGLRRLAFGRERRTRLIALAIEFALLVALAVISQPQPLRVSLLILLAFALGVQNDAFHEIDGIKVNTSFITGDLQNLGAALASRNNSEKQTQTHRRIVVFFTTWIAYAVGALLGAYGALHYDTNALLISAGLVLVAAAILAVSPQRRDFDLK